MSTDADLPRLWQEIGIPGAIDIHTHFLPAPVMQAVWSYFDQAEANYGVPWQITYRWQEDERLAHLRAMGILRFTALVYAHKSGMSAWLNDWALDFAGDVSDCLATATFYPEDGADDYVASALERGARVFKVHLQVGDFDPRDRRLDGVWGQLADAGVPVVVHCGSAPLPGRFTGVEPISEVARRFPQLRLIIAHLGAGEFAEFLDLARTRPNTWLDTTMGLTGFMQGMRPFPERLIPQLRAAARDGQVVFGSDFPNIPYPYAHQVDVLIEHGLDMPEVLWRAPARLLGIPA